MKQVLLAVTVPPSGGIFVKSYRLTNLIRIDCSSEERVKTPILRIWVTARGALFK
jgi:hypothetical protein